MKQYLIRGILSLFVLAVFISSPSISNAQATTTTSTNTATTVVTNGPVACLRFTRTLFWGMRGNDVRSLQTALNINPTGFFGSTTAQLLTNWQLKNGIITSRLDGGILGPLTRSFWLRGCTTPIIVVPPVVTPDPSKDPQCKSWFDGCNTCSRETPGGPATCTQMACVANGNNASLWPNPNNVAYCKERYTTGGSSSLSINSFSGPTRLATGEAGTWTLNVTDTSNGTLTYSVNWGDFNAADAIQAIASNDGAFLQASTTMSLQHTYTRVGSYVVTIDVKSSSGLSTRTMATVLVMGLTSATSTPTICTMEYNPVCGQLPEPACRKATPACMVPTPAPQTYSNRCMLDAAGATYLNDGVCGSTNVTPPTICPMYMKVCPAGQHDVIGNDCSHTCTPNNQPVAIPGATGGACTGASGVYSNGVTVDGQIITGGPFTLTAVWPQYTCTNSLWVCTSYCGVNQGKSFNYSNGTLSPVDESTATSTTSTGAACPYNGQTYPNGTTMSLDITKVPGAVSSGIVPASGMMMVCASIPQYQCQNGDWYKVGTTGCPYYPNIVAAKPVIYLYPTTTENVTVQLKYKGDFTSTYPTYNAGIQGWRVIAHPDGSLVNLDDNKEYSYLFWEGTYPLTIDQSFGFVIKGSDTKDFLQTTLAKMGLTPKEYNEFIVYWLPKMEHNPYNFIQFVGDEYTQSAPLSISPTPDSMLRVFMAYKPLDQFEAVTPQQIKTFDRKGFSVVEWGGTELSK